MGKTTLAVEILSIRKWVTALGTKPADDTLDQLVNERGFHLIRKWPPPALRRRVVLWPEFKRASDVSNQAVQFHYALDEIFAAGSWCVYMDEAFYLSKTLGLEKLMKLLWTMGRSLGISIVAGTQRPAWVPLEMWSQASHLFIFRAADRRDLDRVAEIGPSVYETIRGVAPTLAKHEFLYHSTRTGALVRSRVDPS